MDNHPFIFATDDNNLYDANYEKKIPFSPELSKFPSLSAFESEADFNYAVHQWKKQIKQETKNKVMPVPLSLSTYAPQVANFTNSQSGTISSEKKTSKDSDILKIASDSNYFDYRRNPPLPVTFTEIFDKFIIEDPSDDEKVSFSNDMVHVRNQKQIPINTYTQDNKKWGTPLIPQEPSPELFDTYESYKKSLQNWTSLQNQKLSLLHPSEFVSSIGIIHNENDIYKNNGLYLNKNKEDDKVSKPNAVSQFNVKKFNAQEFLDMELKSTPPSPLLMQLFSLTYKEVRSNNSPSIIKYSDQYNSSKISDSQNSFPFKTPYDKSSLIKKFEEIGNSNSNFESLRITNALHSYKFISDPFINQIFISDPDPSKISLYSDLSPNQMDKAMKSLTPQQYDELINSLPFFLHQLHIVKNPRMRCRFFVIISNILEKKPKLISIFFADVPTLSNVASIISDFTFLDSPTYTFVENTRKKSNTHESMSPSNSSSNPNSPLSPDQNSNINSSLNKSTKISSPIQTNINPTSSKEKSTKISSPLSPNTKSIFMKRNSTPNYSQLPDSTLKQKSSFMVRKSPIIKQKPPSDILTIKKNIDDLTLFLFTNQLSKTLTSFVEKYQPKNRNLLLQINAQTMTFNKFIDLSLTEKASDVEAAFANPTPIICIIFHFLCDYNPVLFSKLFQTNPFYIFLGRVFISPKCHRYYGQLCGHILRHSKLRHIFFLQFFHVRCWLSSKTIMTTIVPTCNFLASLISQESNSEHDITTDEIFTAFTNATQLVIFSPSSSLNLIRSIIDFFLKAKPKTATTGFNTSLSNLSASNSNTINYQNNISSNNNSTNEFHTTTFVHIRESLIALFKDPNLRACHVTILYELMNLMIIPYISDTKSFLERFLNTVVFCNMKSTNDLIAIASWKEFRELFFDPNFQFLRDCQSIKANLSLVTSSKRNMSPPILIEILFLALGINQKTFSYYTSSNTKENSRKKRVRRSINIFDQPEGFIIPGVNPRLLYEEVLRHYTEGHLKNYKNEIYMLKAMMPSFKMRKRTISCA